MAFSRRTISLIGFVFPMLLYVASFIKLNPPHGKYSTGKSRFQDVDPEKQKIVILYSNQRSGSTFMGELFNRNKNAFYLYEPLYPFTPHCEILNQERLILLESMLKCDFSGNRAAFANAQPLTKFPDSNAACIKNSVCFRQQSQALLRNYGDFCRFMNSSTNCDAPYHPDVVSKLCTSSDIVAFKVLRVCSLRDIDELYRNFARSGKEVFVVHLIRDPRAVISSKLKLELRAEDALKRAEELCQKMTRNLQFLYNTTDISKIIADRRYMRIRYEDAATDPIKAASSIYRFLGLAAPEEVIDWIKDSTLQSKQKLSMLEEQLKKSATDKRELSSQYKQLVSRLKNPYSTVKDPTTTIQKWRHLLPFFLVTDVQRICGDVLKRLNYRLLSNEAELEDVSRPVWL